MMIFKRWFKPKWQHQDPVIRQQAIAELDQDQREQKEILHELAFNDGTEAVRRAALERLNEFSLWWQASKHESAERLKQFAEQQLVEMLLTNRVSGSLKTHFIDECHRSSVLEKLALQDPDAHTRLKLLKRLDKPELWQQAILDVAQPLSERQSMLKKIVDDKFIERLTRQADEELAALAVAELQHRQYLRERPEKLRKQVVLLLAKLNAVRERTDVLPAWHQWQDLLSQWQQLEHEVDLLSDAHELRAKVERITQQTQASLWPRVETAQAQAAVVAKREQQQQQVQVFETELIELEKQLTQQLADGELTQVSLLQPKLESITRAVLAAEFDDASRQQLIRHAAKVQQQLDKVPELSEVLAQLARLLADLTAQPLPEPEQVTLAWKGFKHWQQQWQQLAKEIACLPNQFTQSYQQLCTRWQQHCQPLLQQNDKQLRNVKSKLQEFKRLHQQGRFRTLFGLMKGIEQDISQNPELAAGLTKELQQAREQLQELQSLQAYIATPRKQQLVAEMQALASLDVTDVHVRADAVKQARQLWNTLGRADEPLESELNAAFNLACEQAFAPCRDHYAELDKQRQQSAETRQAILDEMRDCAYTELEPRQLEQQLQRWFKAWQDAGMTERDVHQSQKTSYRHFEKQMREHLQRIYDENATAKLALIGQLETQMTNNAPVAVHDVKQLQQQWKAVGFAGKQDQMLWQKFRGLCDQVFAARSEQRIAEQAAMQQVVAEQQAQLATIEQHTGGIEQQLALLSGQDWAEPMQARVQQLISQLRQQQQRQERASQQAVYQHLFAQLSQADTQVEDLPAVYRLVFGAGQEQALTRPQLTIAMELIAGVDSPAAEQSMRQQVQMQLLSEKMNQGDMATLETLLGRFLQYGPLTVSEQPLLDRIRPLFT